MMPDPITAAVVGGSVLSYSSSQSATRAAGRAADKQASAAEAQLAFEKEQYATQLTRWDSTYGSVEQNLADYYSNLDSSYYATRGLEAFQQEQDQALTAVRENLAQRGLATSGTAAAAEITSASQTATTRAGIRAEAEDTVRDQQLNFLSVGMGNKPTSAGVSNAYSNITGVAGQQASIAASSAQQQAAASNQALSNAGFYIATGLSPTSAQANIQTDQYGRIPGGV